MSFLKKLIPGHHGKDKHGDEHTTTGDHHHGAATTTTTTTGTHGAVPSGAVTAEVPLTDGHHHYGPPPHNASATVSHLPAGAVPSAHGAHATGHHQTVDHHHHHATTGVVTGTTTTGVAVGVAPTTGVAATTEQKIILSEEKLVVGKREQEVGGVDISKHIERRTESVPVTLAHEVVSVERRPIAPGTAAQYAGTSTFGKEQHITATVSAEQAIIGKTIVPVEQVQVSKTRVAETEVVQGAVRTENVEVKRDAAHVEGVRHAHTGGVATGATAHAHGATGAPATATSGNILNSSGAVTAFEEHLMVGKERVAAGQVDVHKRVDVSMASAPVRLEHDEVAITRTAVTGPVAVPSSLSQGSVHIGIGRESAQVGTVVVPKEEVVIRKGVQTEQQMVTGEVLREKIDVTTAGAVHVDPAAAHAHAHAHAGQPPAPAHR